MSLSDSWQSFLDACADKGLPFRDWAYALEDKGVPSLPVFVVVLALLLGFLFFFAAPAVQLGQAKGTLRVSVSALGGGEISGEPTVVITNQKTGEKSTKAVAGGIALFANVPAGDYEVRIVSSTLVFTPNNQLQSIEGGKTATLSFEGSSASADLVTLYVNVRGADSAQIAVSYDSGVPVDAATGQSATFQVAKNRDYVVSASQEGYSPVEQRIQVASSNEQVTLTLVKIGVEREAALHVGVFDDAGLYGNPIENATVKVVEE
ncbi:MAG: hypothetical protein V1817_03695, partial [Candidatus Micrarchaeota archaeon]